MIKIANKRISGKEKIRNLKAIDDETKKVKAKAFDAMGNKALTKAEAKRIHKRIIEIDKIIDKRTKQIRKTHKT